LARHRVSQVNSVKRHESCVYTVRWNTTKLVEYQTLVWFYGTLRSQWSVWTEV